MRTFQETHPWIDFQIDLRRAPANLWVALGECQSKCQHVAGVPLRPETAESLHRVFLAKGVQATAAIEGNTLSVEQVQDLVENKLSVPASQRYQQQEVENILGECNRLLARVKVGETLPLTREVIEGFNSGVLRDLAVDDDVVPGGIRKHSVGVGRYRGAPPEDCLYLLDRLCDWLNSPVFDAPQELNTVYAIIKAVIAHLYLAWIHPFGDGNGRTARLLEFQILISSGVPAPAAQLLSNHYNLTRTDYYRQLDKANHTKNGVVLFLDYAVRGFLDGLRDQLQLIGDQQWDVTWRNFVYQHQAFRDKTTPTVERRRRLVLHLSGQAEPVPMKRIPEITPKVARLYAGKTSKTLSRDLNAICEVGLLEKREGGYRARRELILAFLPTTAEVPGPKENAEKVSG